VNFGESSSYVIGTFSISAIRSAVNFFKELERALAVYAREAFGSQIPEKEVIAIDGKTIKRSAYKNHNDDSKSHKAAYVVSAFASRKSTPFPPSYHKKGGQAYDPRPPVVASTSCRRSAPPEYDRLVRISRLLVEIPQDKDIPLDVVKVALGIVLVNAVHLVRDQKIVVVHRAQFRLIDVRKVRRRFPNLRRRKPVRTVVQTVAFNALSAEQRHDIARGRFAVARLVSQRPADEPPRLVDVANQPTFFAREREQVRLVLLDFLQFLFLYRDVVAAHSHSVSSFPPSYHKKGGQAYDPRRPCATPALVEGTDGTHMFARIALGEVEPAPKREIEAVCEGIDGSGLGRRPVGIGI